MQEMAKPYITLDRYCYGCYLGTLVPLLLFDKSQKPLVRDKLLMKETKFEFIHSWNMRRLKLRGFWGMAPSLVVEIVWLLFFMVCDSRESASYMYIITIQRPLLGLYVLKLCY